jgi:hypothetical protein
MDETYYKYAFLFIFMDSQNTLVDSLANTTNYIQFYQSHQKMMILYFQISFKNI